MNSFWDLSVSVIHTLKQGSLCVIYDQHFVARIWMTKSDSEWLWMTLGCSGWPWPTLNDFGCLWMTLDDSGWLWMTLKGWKRLLALQPNLHDQGSCGGKERSKQCLNCVILSLLSYSIWPSMSAALAIVKCWDISHRHRGSQLSFLKGSVRTFDLFAAAVPDSTSWNVFFRRSTRQKS